MKAAEFLVARKLVTCSPSSTLEDAARLMWENDVGALPVVDGDHRPVAMVTDRDICMAALTQRVALWDSHVSTAMSRRVLTCHADTPIADVELMMRDAQIRRVPVVDAQGRLVGIVTLGDIVHLRDEHRLRGAIELPRAARTLAAITERRQAGAW